MLLCSKVVCTLTEPPYYQQLQLHLENNIFYSSFSICFILVLPTPNNPARDDTTRGETAATAPVAMRATPVATIGKFTKIF